MGFDTDKLPKDTLIALAEAKSYQIDAFADGGGIGFKNKYSISSVSIDDSSLTVKDNPFVTVVSRSSGATYIEKLTDGYVMGFVEAK